MACGMQQHFLAEFRYLFLPLNEFHKGLWE